MAEDLEALGGLSGLGRGLAAGMSQTLQFGLTVREQNMKFKLGLGQIGLSLKQLAEQQRENQRRERRFYDGLQHQEIMQTRDIRARRRLQQLADDNALYRQGREFDFRSDEAVLQHERNLELREMADATSRAIARTQAAPRHRANELLERQQNIDLVSDMTSAAQQFITSNVMDDNGNLSAESMIARAKQLGFHDEAGNGNASAYAQQLRSEFQAMMRSRYGNDENLPRIDAGEFNALLHGVVKGDIRGYKVFTDNVTRKLTEAALTLSTQRASDVMLHAMSGASEFPLDIDENADLMYVGANAEAFNDVMRKARDEFPSGAASTQSVETWLKSFDESLRLQVGIDLGLSDPRSATLNPEELAMFQSYFQEFTGIRFPINVSGMNNSAIDSVGWMVKESQNIFGAPIDSVGDLPTGSTRGQQNALATVNTRLAGSINRSRSNFARQMTAGNLQGMVSEYQASGRDLAESIESLDRLGEIGNSNISNAHIDNWRKLLDNMRLNITAEESRRTQETKKEIDKLSPEFSEEEQAETERLIQSGARLPVQEAGPRGVGLSQEEINKIITEKFEESE